MGFSAPVFDEVIDIGDSEGCFPFSGLEEWFVIFGIGHGIEE